MWIPLAIAFLVAFFATALLLVYYINPLKTHWYTQVMAFYGWFIAMFVPLLLPIDIMSTMAYKGEQSFWYVETETLEIIWTIISTSQMVICYLIFPLVQSYASVGNFTFLQKVLESIRRNVILYGTLLLILLIFFVLFWLFRRENVVSSWSTFIGLGLALSNAWGLVLAMLLMGTGVILFLSRTLHQSTFKKRVNNNLREIGNYSKKIEEETKTIKEQLDLLRYIDDSIPSNDPIRKHVETCIQTARLCDAVDYDTSRPVQTKTTLRKLSNIHERLKLEHTKIRRDRQFFSNQLSYGKKLFSLQNSDTGITLSKQFVFSEKYWKKFVLGCRIALFIFFWVFVLWPELLLLGYLQYVNPAIGITALLVESDWGVCLGLVTFVLGIVMIYFAYASFVNMELISWFRMSPRQTTDEYSIMYAGNYLSRVGPSICLNLLHMIGFTPENKVYSLEKTTSFQKVMSSKENVPFFGDKSFNDTFPVCITLVMIGSIILLCVDYRKPFNAIIGYVDFLTSFLGGIKLREIVYCDRNIAYQKGMLILKKELISESEELSDKEVKKNYRKSVMSMRVSKPKKNQKYEYELLEENDDAF
ncbi:LMBR1 family region protein [Entamoeba marina]